MSHSWLTNILTRHLGGRKPIRRRSRLEVEALEARWVPAAMYDIQWLGTLASGDNFSVAQGINDYGQVVGNSYVADSNGIPTNEKAFLFTPGVGMVDLGTAGATGAFAWDINDSGRVTGLVHEGGSLASGGYWEWAAIWDNGVGHTIPGYGQPGMSSTATGVNDSGIVVGHSDVMNWADPLPHSEAFVYDGSTLRFLGTLGGPWSYAMDINNSGFIAGFADTGENPYGGPGVYTSRYHAVIWSPSGALLDLGTFGTDSYAYKINASGMVVGSSIARDGYSHAFLYNGTSLIDIGTPNQNTEAVSINDAGQVIGNTNNWIYATPFLFEGGVKYDLNALVNSLGSDKLVSTHDINNFGQIVGYGQHSGRYEAFVLTPTGVVVPPPPPPTGNAAPTADAGGPYAITDGQSLSLDARLSSDPDGDVLSYSWDVNGDGAYGDATGVAPTLTWSQLQALGIVGGASYSVSVQADDGHGHLVVAGSSLTVSLAPPVTGVPTVTISGPTDGFDGVMGQERTLVLVAEDPNYTGDYEFSVDWGDGANESYYSASGLTVSHTYEQDGDFAVTVTAANAQSLVSDPAVQTLHIHKAEQQGTVLAVGGTAQDDVILLQGGATAGTVISPYGTFATSQVKVFGGKGSDQVIVQGGAGNDAFGINPGAVAFNGVAFEADAVENWTVDGQAGNDTFYLNGVGLPIDILGGDGDDRFNLSATGGVGGKVDGGAGSDILDYALYHSPVTVNLQTLSATATGGFANVEGFVGSNTLLDTILGADATNIWQMYGDNNAGKIGSIQFGSFENWIGGSGADTFKMASARYISGRIDGGAGNNTLDYSLYTAGVSVDLAQGTATNVRGGVLNIANVTGGAGADTLLGDTGDNILLGNAGNDVLSGGPGGNDVLVGGAGNDNLTASAGRNLLIGGLGADVLTGGAGEDLLIGGTTSFDANAAALKSLLAEWQRTDLSYQQRIDHLTGKTSGGLNGKTLLTSKTVKDDKTADTLTGLGGLDWFWALVGEVKDRLAGERVN